MNKVICNILATICLVSLCGCSDDTLNDGSAGRSGGDAFDFSFVTEYESAGTRAYGTAAHIDRLIYKIYRKNSNGVFEKDTYFLSGNTCEVRNYDENGNAIEGEGKYTTLDDCGVIEGSSFSLRLVKNPNDDPKQEYKIICWAQNKDVEYFDLTKFPEKISIDYESSAFANNQEDFDAFYCCHTFKADDKKIDVVLKRPFAQLNIGTAGWDYEGFACIEPKGKVIKYSKIVIDGVAKSFSPLDRKADGVTTNLRKVTYDWAPLPAYRNLDDPTDLYDLTGIYADDHSTEEGYGYNKGVFALKGVEEEMLRIHLPKPDDTDEDEDNDENGEGEGEDGDPATTANAAATADAGGANGNNGNFGEYNDSDYEGEYVDYIGWKKYNALSAKYKHETLIRHIFTETFKYLSMCYVLVPFDDSGETPTGQTVSIKFDCSDGEKKTSDGSDGSDSSDSSDSSDTSDGSDGSDGNGDADGEYIGVFGDRNALELDNVPVNSNHRTNIIATDGTGFFMNTHDLKVYIHTETFADFYKHFRSNDETWDEDTNEGHGEHGDKDNGDYNWPGADFDPDLYKPQMDLPGCTGEERYLVATQDKVIHAYYYVDNDARNEGKSVKFKISALNPTQLTGYNKDYSYDFILGSETLAENEYAGNTRDGYDVEIGLDKLLSLTDSNDKALDNDYLMYYYPVKFKVKTKLTKEDNAEIEYRAPENLVVTIRLYPLYDSYTFSSDSEDDGGEIWNKFETEGTWFRTEQYTYYDEKGNKASGYYQTYGINSSKELSYNGLVVHSRGGTGKNDYAARFEGRGDAGDQADHIMFFGASTDADGSGIMPQNHYIKFDVDKKCKITVKWGRDMDADNASIRDNDIYDRKLIINWGQTENLQPQSGEDRYWEGYPISDKANTYDRSTTTNSYLRTESRIAKAVTTDDITSRTPVYIYEGKSATSVYWILVSPAE